MWLRGGSGEHRGDGVFVGEGRYRLGIEQLERQFCPVRFQTAYARLLLDMNIGYTRQRIGAEGFDIVSNFGLDVLKIPGTNGPDRLQGGVPAFQINGGWTDIGNDNTGTSKFAAWQADLTMTTTWKRTS